VFLIPSAVLENKSKAPPRGLANNPVIPFTIPFPNLNDILKVNKGYYRILLYIIYLIK